jgi:lysozyme
MIDLIKKYEGLSLRPYKCPAGVWTIGYGNTSYPDGTPVKGTDNPISIDKADAMLRSYVIANILPNIENLNLTPSQTEAVVSLVYNIGWASFARSKCYKAIKKKDWGTAFINWDWISGGGKVLKGLIKRRAEEKHLFFKDI